jgi:outer membrane immunogenic protein
MKKLLLASAALGALMSGGAANAADMPAYRAPPPMVAPYYSWTGIYFGGFVGTAWGNADRTYVAPPTTGRVDVHGAGVLAGLTVGANYQVGYWVLGAEADYGWTNYNGSKACPNTFVATCHSNVDAVATFAGRLGYAWDRVLLYAKGGGAWKRGDENFTFNATGQLGGTAKDDRSGWMLGGGMEFGFLGPWSAKVEYNYMDFGTKRVAFSNVVGGLNERADIKEQIHAVKFGINYRLGHGPVYANY